jgi:hypothetical protein
MPIFQCCATVMKVFLLEEVSQMIHRDLCDPVNTKYYSPLRMKFHFLVSRYVCWDGLISLTRKEMAHLLDCDMQSVTKFIKKGIREDILSLQGDRLFLLKRVDQYSEGYIKHFPFLESQEFMALSVHAQRFILYTLWAGVHTGRPLKRNLCSLYHANKEYNGVLNIYSRAPIYAVLEEAKTFLDLEIIVQNDEEFVRVKGLHASYEKQTALENQGEKKLLMSLLEAEGFDEVLSETACHEILKIKKHYFQKLQGTGMELFSHALEKLLSVHKLFDLNKRREVGIYLKSILNDLEQQIIPTLQKRVEYIKRSLSHATKNLWLHKKGEVIETFQCNLDKLIKNLQSLTCYSTSEQHNAFPFYNWLETE